MQDDDLIRDMQRFGRRLDWNLLKTFHDIVQANGITAAANSGWRKQSTISLALKRLESILGSRLCQRGRAGFELTDEGRILYDYVKRIYGNIEEIPGALANLDESISGALDIAVISNLHSDIVNNIYISFNERHNNVTINLVVLPWDAVSKCILNNDYDIGISPILFKHNDLECDFLMREYHNIYCGRSHHLFGKRLSPSTLADEQFILTGSDEPDSLTGFRLRHSLGRKVTARTPSLEEARRLAITGIGVCILPEQFVSSDVNDGMLWPLMGRTAEMSCDIYLISHKYAPKRAAREAFIGTAMEVAGREPEVPDWGQQSFGTLG